MICFCYGLKFWFKVVVLTDNNKLDHLCLLVVSFLFMTGSDGGNKDVLSLHLVQLLSEAEKQLEEKSQPSSSPVRGDLDKHVALWKRRVRILRKMKTGLEQLSLFCLESCVQINCDPIC